MLFQERKHFAFASQGLPEDTFTVVRFRGTEVISRPYEFDITLSSEDPDIDLKDFLQNPATLTILRGDERHPIHGMPCQFEQLHELKRRVFYRAILVPRLWQAGLYRENQLFLDKTVPEIIEEMLKQAGLRSQDYEFKLTRSYPSWEYICQYQETDLNFISRWMEREGIYYFFEQTDEVEKLIITDSLTAHQEIKGEKTLFYSPPSGLLPAEEEVVKAFVCRQRVLPKKVILKDYNYRKPSLEVKAEAEVDPKGRGETYIYGEHFKDPGEGKDLAKIRAEELLCRETVFHGEGTAPSLVPGFLFELAEHFRNNCNRRYLVTEVEHRGTQTGLQLSGLEEEQIESEKEPGYSNRFSCIPADVQFRPERTSPRPRIAGTMNAAVDAAGDGKYAEIDDQGRYKVILPFDISGRSGGKASRWVRMSQPYSGPEYGMHFPLHKGAEVVLIFVDGDPDRPIISGSAPNPETMTPVTNANQTQGVIRTAGGNEILIEDIDKGQQIRIRQACGNEMLLDGKQGEEKIHIRQPAGHEFLMDGTKGKEKIRLRDKYGNEIVLNSIAGTLRVHSPSHQSTFTLGKSLELTTDSDENRKIYGSGSEFILGHNQLVIGGINSEFIIGLNHSSTIGGSWTENLAYERDKNWAGRTRRASGALKYDSEQHIDLIGGPANDSWLRLCRLYAALKSGSRTKIQLQKNSDILFFTPTNVDMRKVRREIRLGKKLVVSSAQNRVRFSNLHLLHKYLRVTG